MHLRRSRSSYMLGIGAAAVGLLTATVQATPTDPSLALRAASAMSGPVVMLRIEGSFHASDLTQVAFPLQVLVRDLDSGADYLRYDIARGGFSGTDWMLADGLQARDVTGLLAGGTPEPTAQLLELSEDRIDLTLPSEFAGRRVEVQLFVVHGGTAVLSNPLSLWIGEAS